MIIRKCESNIKQLDCEILQGGYIFRFNEIMYNRENIEFYEYDEIYFENIPDVGDFNVLGYSLNNNQLQFIIHNMYNNDEIILNDEDNVISLDELKQIKLNEFNPILNEFTLLISRAKLISGESRELEIVINIIKAVKDDTVNKIKSFDNINELSKFKFLNTDIEYLKNLLNPFLF